MRSNKVIKSINKRFLPLGGAKRLALTIIKKKLLPKYDVIIVSDYGHGLISNKSAKIIEENSNQIIEFTKDEQIFRVFSLCMNRKSRKASSIFSTPHNLLQIH